MNLVVFFLLTPPLLPPIPRSIPLLSLTSFTPPHLPGVMKDGDPLFPLWFFFVFCSPPPFSLGFEFIFFSAADFSGPTFLGLLLFDVFLVRQLGVLLISFYRLFSPPVHPLHLLFLVPSSLFFTYQGTVFTFLLLIPPSHFPRFCPPPPQSSKGGRMTTLPSLVSLSQLALLVLLLSSRYLFPTFFSPRPTPQFSHKLF